MSKSALPPKPKASARKAELPPADPQTSFPIVGIGASAGGLAALEGFLAALPTANVAGMAFVIIQHLSPDHKSILSDLLKRYTQLNVLEAEDGMAIRRDSVYVIPPNSEMGILDDKL